MNERTSTREILNRTNEVFLLHPGKIVAPALVAGFLGYWVSWSNGWLEGRLAYAIWRNAHGNINAATRGVVIPGIAVRLLLLALTFLIWATAFAIVARMLVSSRKSGEFSLGYACRDLTHEAGWPSLLLRLCWRLVIPGYLLMMISAPVVYWAMTILHLSIRTVAGRMFSEMFSLVVFGFLYLLYAHRFALAIPLPLVAGDRPVDPFAASASASKKWRATIIVSCLLVWAVSSLGDLHLPRMLLKPGLVQPTVLALSLIHI